MANWKKISVIAADVVLAAYLVLAMTAFNKPKETHSICTDVIVRFNGGQQGGFMNEDDVVNILNKNHSNPKGQPLKNVNTRIIEETLRKSIFVEQAECFKTQGGKVCIELTQRKPVLRVLSDNGDRYYLDTHGEIIPDNIFISNLIVATGAISRNYAKTTLAPLAMQLAKDKFWQSQTEQLNILPDGSVEIIPRVGDHIAYLGQPEGTERKLNRLRKFYLYGLSQAGWNKYSYISVEFNNQIICKKNK